MSNTEILQSLKTIQEMLETRGYDQSILNEAFETLGEKELASIIQSRTSIFNIDVIDPSKNRLRIIYDVGSKIKYADIRKLVDVQNFDTFMFIVKEKINANDYKKFFEFECCFQVFDLKELQFNISKHVLVPKHELITNEDEINELVKKYMLKSKTQFPIILKTDPMAKFLFAKPGNIVKITRNSPTAAEHIVYRCCM